MKKIDFNIQLPEDRIFDLNKFKKEKPDLYEKYMTNGTEPTIVMQRIEETVSNMMSRSLNKVEIDKKDFREKPTASVEMPDQTKYARVVNAINDHKDGWVKMEDADFDFMKKNWDAAKCPVYKNTALQFKAIDDAIKIAALKKGNPDKEK